MVDAPIVQRKGPSMETMVEKFSIKRITARVPCCMDIRSECIHCKHGNRNRNIKNDHLTGGLGDTTTDQDNKKKVKFRDRVSYNLPPIPRHHQLANMEDNPEDCDLSHFLKLSSKEYYRLPTFKSFLTPLKTVRTEAVRVSLRIRRLWYSKGALSQYNVSNPWFLYSRHFLPTNPWTFVL